MQLTYINNFVRCRDSIAEDIKKALVELAAEIRKILCVVEAMDKRL